jgi:hypothetical protein
MSSWRPDNSGSAPCGHDEPFLECNSQPFAYRGARVWIDDVFGSWKRTASPSGANAWLDIADGTPKTRWVSNDERIRPSTPRQWRFPRSSPKSISISPKGSSRVRICQALSADCAR